jgi:hypothetical protein
VTESPHRALVIAPGDVLPEDVLARQSQANESHAIQQNRWAILTVLFVVTGAFGLSLLWRSERFSFAGKCVWSLLVTAYTLGLFYLMVMLIRWSIGETP